MEIKKTFAERLKEARIKANISQSELSKITGIAPATLSTYENIENPKSPPTDKAAIIAKALNVSLDWLCGLEDSEESETLTVQSILNAIITLSMLATSEVETENKSVNFNEYELFVNIKLWDNGLCEFVSEYTKIMDFIKGNDCPLYLKNGLKKALFDKYIKKYQIYNGLFLSDKEKDKKMLDDAPF